MAKITRQQLLNELKQLGYTEQSWKECNDNCKEMLAKKLELDMDEVKDILGDRRF